jgi:hypothetical protein
MAALCHYGCTCCYGCTYPTMAVPTLDLTLDRPYRYAHAYTHCGQARGLGALAYLTVSAGICRRFGIARYLTPGP